MSAKVAVMGPEAAVNAVYANKIQAIDDVDERAAYVAERRAEYEADVDLYRLAADLVIESVPPDIAQVPTGMIALREGPALPALRTLSEGIVASAQRRQAA